MNLFDRGVELVALSPQLLEYKLEYPTKEYSLTSFTLPRAIIELS